MKAVLVAAALAFSLAPPALAQTQIDFSKLDIITSDLGHGVYLLNWKTGDSIVLTGPDGVLLVDDYMAPLHDKLIAAITKVSGGKPVRYVVNAHAHADHFGGNELMAKAGAVIVAQENVRTRMESGWYIAAFKQIIPPQPAAALPTITYADKMTIHFDGEDDRSDPRACGAYGQRFHHPFQECERHSHRRRLRERDKLSVLRPVDRRFARGGDQDP